MLLLVEDVFSLIPFKTWFWHFTIPYSYMGPYNTAALLVNEQEDVGSKASPKSEIQSEKKGGVILDDERQRAGCRGYGGECPQHSRPS